MNPRTLPIFIFGTGAFSQITLQACAFDLTWQPPPILNKTQLVLKLKNSMEKIVELLTSMKLPTHPFEHVYNLRNFSDEFHMNTIFRSV